MWWSTVPKSWGGLVMKEHWGLCDIAVDVFWKVRGIKGCYLSLCFCLHKLCEAHSCFSSDRQARSWTEIGLTAQFPLHEQSFILSFFFHIREKVGFLFYFILLLFYEHLLLREMVNVFLKCKIKNVRVETAARVSHLTLNILVHQTMV